MSLSASCPFCRQIIFGSASNHVRIRLSFERPERKSFQMAETKGGVRVSCHSITHRKTVVLWQLRVYTRKRIFVPLQKSIQCSHLFTLPREGCHDDAETSAPTLILACSRFKKSLSINFHFCGKILEYLRMHFCG